MVVCSFVVVCGGGGTVVVFGFVVTFSMVTGGTAVVVGRGGIFDFGSGEWVFLVGGIGGVTINFSVVVAFPVDGEVFGAEDVVTTGAVVVGGLAAAGGKTKQALSVISISSIAASPRKSLPIVPEIITYKRKNVAI